MVPASVFNWVIQSIMLITLENVSKNFAEREVIQGVNLQLNSGEKVGLVGANGSGKTTLLRIIQGDLEPDDGQVCSRPNIKIGFLQQMVQIPSHQSILEEAVSVFSEIHHLAKVQEALASQIGSGSKDAVGPLLVQYGNLQERWEFLGGYTYEATSEQVLFGLGFQRSDLQRRVEDLSGGELNRLSLAKLLLGKPDLLLLDEPTNHLDSDAIDWLGRFLESSGHTYILVSHDRYFLDNAADKIIEISGGQLETYFGNYSSFFKQREKRHRNREKAYQQQTTFIKTTEEFIRKNLAGQKTKQAQSRRNMLGRLEKLERQPTYNTLSKFRFGLRRVSSMNVLTVTSLTVGYPKDVVLARINFWLYRGQRLGIVGPNGSGKTTLLRTLLGEIKPRGGDVLVGQHVQFAYYHQHLLGLNGKLNVLEEIRLAAPSTSEVELRNHLAAFLFRGKDVFSRVASLSGGEKSRLSLAKLVLSQANTLILDEPSNHLDLPSREALEEALRAYPGTILIVSHDRYLINKVADRLLILDGHGQCHLFEGTYAEWESCRTNQEQISSISPPNRKEYQAPKWDVPQKLSKNELRRTKDRCNYLEQEINQVESQIKAIASKMNTSSIAANYSRLQALGQQHQQCCDQRELLYTEWEQVLTLLENQ